LALGTNTFPGTVLSNGTYTATLDFGADAFNGDARWLELALRTNGAADFTTLAPRQAVTPTPYAIRAANAGSVSGTIPDAQLSANVARLNATNAFNGPVTAPQFLGDGSGLSGVAPASGSTNYVAKAGDTMTGTLNLPVNGLTAGGNQLTLANGNVGIGTTTPDARLHIQGDGSSLTLMLDSTSARGANLAFLQNGVNRGGLGVTGALMGNTSSDLGILSQAGSRIVFYANGDNPERLTIATNGNVGIGTANPQQQLALTGGIGFANQNATDKKLYSPVDGLFEWMTQDAAGEPGFAISHQGERRFLFRTIGYSYLNGGNVGIGTANPQQQLTLTGGIGFGNQNATDKKLYSPVDGLLEWMTQDAAGEPGFAISHQGERRFLFRTVGYSYLNGGNVGIGTTSPVARLHIQGDGSSPTLVLDSTASRGANFAMMQNGINRGGMGVTGALMGNTSSDLGILSQAGSRIVFYANGDNPERLTIATNGNVGIGTASPTARLEVAGSLKVSGAGNSITTPILSITGGSDVAEPFAMSGGEIPPGAVVVIDAAHPGQLKLSGRRMTSAWRASSAARAA
jgi:hypothetical protein